MGTFLLVHGAWHGGWCWNRVADVLRGAGHRVVAPTLTGVGDRAHLTGPNGTTCSTHVDDVLAVVRWEELDDFVICGHSYGGVVAGVVADRLAERICGAVFLDSIVPEDGKSFLDQIGTPETIAHLVSQLDSQGRLPPFTAESFAAVDAEHERIDRLCTPQAFATFSERMSISGRYEMIAHKIHVEATGWANSPFAPHHQRARTLPGWETISIASGHEVMIDQPDLVAEILVKPYA